MTARIGAFLLLLVSCCGQKDMIVAQEWNDCLAKGGSPSLYMKEFSKPKAQGVACERKDDVYN